MISARDASLPPRLPGSDVPRLPPRRRPRSTPCSPSLQSNTNIPHRLSPSWPLHRFNPVSDASPAHASPVEQTTARMAACRHVRQSAGTCEHKRRVIGTRGECYPMRSTQKSVLCYTPLGCKKSSTRPPACSPQNNSPTSPPMPKLSPRSPFILLRVQARWEVVQRRYHRAATLVKLMVLRRHSGSRMSTALLSVFQTYARRQYVSVLWTLATADR
ncbi:hypothetical protein C2E23DRAFT_853871 [Lenzites betulinus]|nr:hypothetical protein C2E23DRAFT_853871 [Lenzites betulinus]